MAQVESLRGQRALILLQIKGQVWKKLVLRKVLQNYLINADISSIDQKILLKKKIHNNVLNCKPRKFFANLL